MDYEEVWKDGILISGGKHDDHLEVDVQAETNGNGNWTITVTPMHAFPLVDHTGRVTAWKRGCWHDAFTITQLNL
ncbi:MAG: hypothetical protein WKF77_06910 [Planctomycetaceae bacterium]